MQPIAIALAATMLASVIGTAPAAAAPVMTGSHVESLDVELTRHRGRRHGDDRRWHDDDDDDDDRWERRRHRSHYRPRCHTEWVFRFSHYGPEWYPVRVCHRRPRHW